MRIYQSYLRQYRNSFFAINIPYGEIILAALAGC